jgi:Family of unknown function (DUF6789)
MKERLQQGFLWGLLATLAMTALMLLGMVTGLSPIPRPIPIALAAWALGAVPRPLLMVAGTVAHFAYGGIAGAVFAAVLGRRAGPLGGLLFGGLLWLGMGLFFLPLLHWGAFGRQVGAHVGGATLLLHAVYGAVLGTGLWLRTRRGVAVQA